MSASCHHVDTFDGASPAYRRALLAVIMINATMFLVEMWFGIRGESQALKADALDFLSDSATYAVSLWAIGKASGVRSKVALLKGYSLLFIAAWVLCSTVYYAVVANSPAAPIMGSIAMAALLANLASVLLLLRFRDGDANVRSVWLCSRNDTIGNAAVLLAAGLVYVTQTHWPDLIVAFLLASLFSSSAVQIIRQARQERLAEPHSHH
ncbi:cation transporter [Arenicella xantha]|uniref:Co/Zn/Cd efflux system component n=1 Tax=Arenicella xantha TaxID=644221 RepID=A0A395JM08_9GAMM|nr:cation transporter [Arenicella xantha]RBP50887.1 Co/Zn/Cd efflux system component [Arenicella xantha]